LADSRSLKTCLPAGLGGLGTADQAGFLNELAGAIPQDILCGGDFVLGWYKVIPLAARRNLAPLLRGVVFVGEAALDTGLDFQRTGLRCGGFRRLWGSRIFSSLSPWGPRLLHTIAFSASVVGCSPKPQDGGNVGASLF
jgi:hypothetical protein